MMVNTQAYHVQVNIAYSHIVAVLLELKAGGITTDQLADAIVRAAYEAGVDRIK